VKITSLFSLILVDFRDFRQKVRQKSDKKSDNAFFALGRVQLFMFDFCNQSQTDKTHFVCPTSCPTFLSDKRSRTPALWILSMKVLTQTAQEKQQLKDRTDFCVLPTGRKYPTDDNMRWYREEIYDDIGTSYLQ
jgi:hypothetical protein